MSAVPQPFTGVAANDPDIQETREWVDALSAVIQSEGNERAHFLLEQLIDPLLPASAVEEEPRTGVPDAPRRHTARPTPEET